MHIININCNGERINNISTEIVVVSSLRRTYSSVMLNVNKCSSINSIFETKIIIIIIIFITIIIAIVQKITTIVIDRFHCIHGCCNRCGQK